MRSLARDVEVSFEGRAGVIISTSVGESPEYLYDQDGYVTHDSRYELMDLGCETE